ncbi:MAG: AsnC family transcriptional regulator [Dehalococcoidia bacterium]|nr:AsnC family transcriptional regulator [Dehalococcoidia bacterium]
MAATKTTMDLVDRKLLNIIQSEFPLVDEPYKNVGDALGIDEDEVIRRLAELRKQNVVRQISAIFDTRRLGYRTSLIAMALEASRLGRGAKIVNRHPGVSHNYGREGSYYNLWFTLAVPPDEVLEDTVGGMAEEAGALSYRIMPTLRFFKIGVNFDMVEEKGAAHNFSPDGYGNGKGDGWNVPVPVTQEDIDAIRELQEDLPLVSRPFDDMARRLGMTTVELFEAARDFQRRSIMRRYSAVLHHRKAGFRANGMGVWKVPAEMSEQVGSRMASHPAVTHCYERPTFPDWPYSHFTMIHATSRTGCEQVASEISEAIGITDYLMLYSTREFKKTRVRYFV